MKCFLFLLIPFQFLTASAQTLTLFGTARDHCVLQRSQPLPFSGTGTPGAPVEVWFADETLTTSCDESGRWSVTFPAQPAGGPFVLNIQSGDETIHYTDILIGDVWVCAGQSNMVLNIGYHKGNPGLAAKADHPEIRFTTMPNRIPGKPQNTVPNLTWQPCTPETVERFSGVAYHFAAKVQENIRVPVGVIIAARGGTFIEAWTPERAFREDGPLAPVLERWEWLDNHHSQLTAQQLPLLTEWEHVYGEKFKAWRELKDQGPFLPAKPSMPPDINNNLRPAVMYNNSIHPATFQPVKGVVWYQGESNSDRGYAYRDLLKILIREWRDAWDLPKLPFVIVQLPNYDHTYNPYGPQDGGPWAVVRESQAAALDLPRTSLAVTLGEGDEKDVHPADKSVVGTRAALSALQHVYNQPVAGTAPFLSEFTVSGNLGNLRFAETGSGLRTLDGNPPVGFEVAGTDRVFHPAEAEITAPDTVQVFSENVPRPVAVRHAWRSHPRFNVINSAGLPLSTLRTDHWRLENQEKTLPFWWLQLPKED